MNTERNHNTEAIDSGYVPLEALDEPRAAAGGPAGERAAGAVPRKRRRAARAPETRRRPLRRSASSVLVAATLAAWIPFSVAYLGSTPPAASVPTVTVSNSGGHPVVTTRTSTGQVLRTPSTASTPGTAVASVAPISTRAS